MRLRARLANSSESKYRRPTPALALNDFSVPWTKKTSEPKWICAVGDFPFKIPFKKCFKIVFSFALVPRSGFGAAISHAVARSSIVLRNSVSGDRIVMAASRLLGAAAACVILLSFAAGHRKS